MANLVVVRVPEPQNVLDTYGAAALYRIERDTTSAFLTGSEVTTGVVAATATEYEYKDATGTSSHYYRIRYSKASPSVGADYSGYGPVFQAGAVSEYTNLERIHIAGNISDTTDDAALTSYIGSANGLINREIGVFIGPSVDTVRLYDGRDAHRNGRRLWVAGGIRTLTAVSIGTYTGGTLTSQTLSDFYLGPSAQNLRAGQPYMRVDISEMSAATFYPGIANVQLTGTFGYASVPDDLAKLADRIVLGMWEDRNAQSRTASYYVFPKDMAMLEEYRRESFALVA